MSAETALPESMRILTIVTITHTYFTFVEDLSEEREYYVENLQEDRHFYVVDYTATRDTHCCAHMAALWVRIEFDEPNSNFATPRLLGLQE